MTKKSTATLGHTELVTAIASRQWTGGQLSTLFNKSVEELKEFVDTHREEIEEARVVYEDLEKLKDIDLKDLWISSKAERLRRLQNVCDSLYAVAVVSLDSTILRELRSYLFLASNELGQLMHRGSGATGDSDSASYTLHGVDLDAMR